MTVVTTNWLSSIKAVLWYFGLYFFVGVQIEPSSIRYEQAKYCPTVCSNRTPMSNIFFYQMQNCCYLWIETRLMKHYVLSIYYKQHRIVKCTPYREQGTEFAGSLPLDYSVKNLSAAVFQMLKLCYQILYDVLEHHFA